MLVWKEGEKIEIKTYIVYKFYNCNNELLYVGITNDLKHRINQHKNKEWYSEISQILTSNNFTKNEAHIYEIFFIANDNPKYNINHIKGGCVNFILPEIKFKKLLKVPQEKRVRIKINKTPTEEKFLYLESIADKRLLKEEQKELIDMIDLRDKRNRQQKSIKQLNLYLEENNFKYFIVSKRTKKNNKQIRYWQVIKCT